MRRLVVFVVMWAGACGSQPAIVTPSPPRSPEPVLKQPAATVFGLVVDGVYKRQSRFELAEDTVYGWRIKLPCFGPTLFRETLQLPGAAGDWTLDPAVSKHMTLSADRRRVVIDDYSGCYDGWIQHAWTIAPKDPPGEYAFTVEVEGYRPQTFRGRFIRSEDARDVPSMRRSRR